ncbi:MAG: hypothetical protein GY801_48975 [bacterium]|nr:hypothetical protein [bacterium]
MQIPENNIDPSALQKVFDIVSNVLTDGGGKVKLTTLLAILNFPPDVTKRIQTSRGDVVVKGLTADGPLFFNFDLDAITIKLPRFIDLDL